MPLILKPENVLEVGSNRAVDEVSDERFDRAAFARRAIDLVHPRRTTIALCEGASRLRVESGRIWGRDGERWALLALPAMASRRAIALAVLELAGDASSRAAAYVLDVLMDEADGDRPAAETSAA
jgi:hypothetical protein